MYASGASTDYKQATRRGRINRLFVFALLVLVLWYYIKFQSLALAFLPAFIMSAVGAAFIFFKSFQLQVGYLIGILLMILLVPLSLQFAGEPPATANLARVSSPSRPEVHFVRDPRVLGLLARLSNPDPEVRLIALQLVGEVAHPRDSLVMKNVVPLLSDENRDVRFAALWLFVGKVFPPAESVPALMVLLEDKEVRVRARAAQALGRVDRGAHQSVSALIRRLSDDSPWVRSAAAHALAHIGSLEAAHAALPVLAAELHSGSSDKFTRQLAAVRIGLLGPLAESAVPELIAALSDEESIVRFAAWEALGKINTPQARGARAAMLR